MGAVVSKAANGLGSVIGNAVVAPFKTVFGASCEGVCSGTWDFTCFVEHLCVSNLVRLLMVVGLCYILLMFFYLLFQLGIIQCVGRSLCKVCWGACETYWSALAHMTCFLCHKLRNTKRVYRRRRRFQDVEEAYSSSDNDSVERYESLSRKRRWDREKRRRRKHRIQTSLYPVKLRSKVTYPSQSFRHHHHHGVKHKTRGVSLRVKGGPGRMRNSRQLQVRKTGNFGKQVVLFKRKKRR